MTDKSTSWLKKSLFGLIALPIFIVVIALCAMNAREIDFMWLPIAPLVHTPLFLPLLAFFTTGFIIGWLLSRLET